MRMPNEINIKRGDQDNFGVMFKKGQELSITFYSPLHRPFKSRAADPEISFHLVDEKCLPLNGIREFCDCRFLSDCAPKEVTGAFIRELKI